MATQLIRYPLDPTGVSPDNLIVGEQHTLVNRTVRAFAPLYGAFFTESVILRDRSNNAVLAKGTQWRATELYEFPTGRWGKEICGIILVIDPSVSNDVEIQYQALGGEYSTNVDAIIQMFNEAMLDRPVAWPDIFGKPDAFNPAAHFHDAGDIYGFEYVVNAIERLRQAVLTGDVASHEDILRYIDRQDNEIADSLSTANSALSAHTGNFSNPHQTTKSQVGLGSVENYPVASQAEAVTGTANDRYMTPLRTKNAIDSVTAVYAQHISRTDNPHSVTKAQVGLGSVENYAVATQAEAQAGVVNVKYMTPQRTKEAIDAMAGIALATHTARTDNPHAVTKSHVGLGSVQNYDIATKAEAEAGISNTKYMTPLRVREAVTSQVLTVVNTHATRTDNPHAVTKDQVGLGLVQNFPPATPDDGIDGGLDNAYMTPVATAAALEAHSRSNAHDSRYVRHNTTVNTSLRVYGNQLHAFVDGSWRIVWPPQWDGGDAIPATISFAWNPDDAAFDAYTRGSSWNTLTAKIAFMPDGTIDYGASRDTGPLSYTSYQIDGIGSEYEIQVSINTITRDSTSGTVSVLGVPFESLSVGYVSAWTPITNMAVIQARLSGNMSLNSRTVVVGGTISVRKIGTSTVYSKPFTVKVESS